MTKKIESWSRLKAAPWLSTPSIAKMNDKTADFQILADGVGDTFKDEYSIEFSRMSNSLSAEIFLSKFAADPNLVTNSSIFNTMGKFKKRSSDRIAVGDIYDIDALGPNNGSIVIVQVSPGFGISSSLVSHWFIIQTIVCEKTGKHPECGAREFGFERFKEGVRFYTRGISRPADRLVKAAGSLPQNMTWKALMEGFRKTIVSSGGQWNGKPIRSERLKLGG